MTTPHFVASLAPVTRDTLEMVTHVVRPHKQNSLFLRPAHINFSWLTLLLFCWCDWRNDVIPEQDIGVLSLFHHTYDVHWQVLPAPQANSVQTWSKPHIKLLGGALKIK